MNTRIDLQPTHCGSRRAVLKSAMGIATLGVIGASLVGVSQRSRAAAMTKEMRDQLTPDQIIENMKEGNERFAAGKMSPHDYVAQKRATVAGQYPAAVILSCIDSRAPAEILFDSRIGDTFSARVAGNISNDDILGSMEFACALAGAKVVLVMGHTACGAIKGAIDSAQLGNLTGLLNKIKPAVIMTSNWLVALSLLCQGADPNIRLPTGDTPLPCDYGRACRSGYGTPSLWCRRIGRCLPGGVKGITAIHLASANNNIAAIRLLSSHGASVSCRDANGETPLFYATAQDIQKLSPNCTLKELTSIVYHAWERRLCTRP